MQGLVYHLNPRIFSNKLNKLVNNYFWQNHAGIASLLLSGGRTAHSRFDIPIDLSESSTCEIKRGTYLSELIAETSLKRWDETPMVQKYAFEAVDKTLGDILAVKNPEAVEKSFGGKMVLLGGDFRQILPVVPKEKRSHVVDACINNSYLWEDCELFTLKRNMRVTEKTTNDNEGLSTTSFKEWLLQVKLKQFLGLEKMILLGLIFQKIFSLRSGVVQYKRECMTISI